MPLVRHLAILAALAAFLAATLGVPIPAPSPKDLSKPFPCMDRTCGCLDAAQCWKGCCCFTDGEKLVWAAAHDVEPPAFVVASARKAKQCCDHHQAKGHLESGHLESGHLELGRLETSHLEKGREHNAHEHQSESRFSSRAKTANLVIASAWRRCHGLVSTWSLMGAVTPPPEAVTCYFEWTEMGRVCAPSLAATTLTFPPPLPPPRAA